MQAMYTSITYVIWSEKTQIHTVKSKETAVMIELNV